MKKIPIIFLVLSSFFICGDTHSLIFTIKSENQSIKVNEPIVIEIKFQSCKGLFRLYKERKFGMAAAASKREDWMKFKIVAPLGKELSYDLRIPGVKRPMKYDFVDVFPKNPYIEIIKIYFGNRSDRRTFLNWPEKGKYKITSYYFYKKNIHWVEDPGFWEGGVNSNTIEVYLD